jgi:hypothetical protein
MSPSPPLIQVPSDVYDAMLRHLLPATAEVEQAAFMFVQPDTAMPGVFKLIEWFGVPPEGFVVQLPYHFELTDETRATMIKRAHDLQASVVEVHSHIGHWKPQFSPSDWSGFEELLPHMWWRLKGRPYFAVVVTTQGIDAFAWLLSPDTPERLGGLQVGDKLIEPSQISALYGSGYDRTRF